MPLPNPTANLGEATAEQKFASSTSEPVNDPVLNAEKGVESDSDTSPAEVQDGVKRAEAMTAVWSTPIMVTMFILLWLVCWADGLGAAVQGSIGPQIVSTLGLHSLVGVTDLLPTIVGGVSNLAIAKVIDIWGRAEGFAVMTVLILVGLIMKATFTNIETYTAANTIHWVGHIGIQYIVTIMYADMTSMKNRMILIGLQQVQVVSANFGGPQIGTLFFNRGDFHWPFGTFIIVIGVLSIPIMAIFIMEKRKAAKAGLIPARASSGKTVWEKTKFYFVQFDVIGMFLTIFGWVLLLLPFSLTQYAPNGWRTGYIIAMIVLGVVLLVAFAVWEKFFAPVSYLPFKYLTNRTILTACLLNFFMFLSIFLWDVYYYSYLMVVHELDIPSASYILNTFSVSAAIISPFVGLYISKTGDYWWISVAATPLAILGTALLNYFRHPGTQVGYLVMCQLFNGLASGIWALTAQLAIMAQVSHQEIAVTIALFSLFGSIGASIGNAAGSGMWTNFLPQKLQEWLPDEDKPNWAEIYGDITTQLSFPMGSPARTAIIDGYGFVMRRMVIAGSCFLPLCLFCVLIWKRVNVSKIAKRDGTF